MVANDLDVLIIGARVAGSSLASLLGRQGRRVLLVDRDHFPSDTLSTHLLAPPAVAALGQLGVLADVEASGLRRLVRTRSYVGECVLEGPMMPVPPGYGLAPRRDRLDWILIQHAIEHSTVTFQERTRAVDLLRDGERVVGAVLQDTQGQRREVRARAVVGADGKNSDVARWVEATVYEEVPPLRPGYYGYYRNVAPLPDPTLELFFIGDHIGFLFPMEPGLDCLAMEITPAEFETFRKESRQAFEARFGEFPGMERRLRDATPDGRIMGTRGVENYFRTPFGPGWALTGDAAYCKDPSTGLGIGDAFTQAFLLAEAIAAGIDGDWAKELAAYHKARDAMLMPLYEATLSFTKAPPVPAESLDALHAVLSAPGLARALAIGFGPTVQTSPAFTDRGHGMIAMLAGAFAARRVLEITANGLRFHAIDEGTGAPVLLLHGFPDTSRLWRRQIDALVGAGFRAVAPDLRGRGQSDKPKGVDQYALPLIVQDVVGILDALGIERAHVVGHDWGAAVAWLVASLQPQRVNKLVTISVGNPAASPKPTLESLQKGWYRILIQFPDLAEELFRRDDWYLLREMLQGGGRVDEYIRNLSEPEALTAGFNWYRANLPVERLLAAPPPLPPVQSPTLGIYGARDLYVTEDRMTESARTVTGGWRYERFDDAGHWVPLEQPERLNRLLIDFLT